MADGALSDVVVLEVATGVGAPYAAKLLADLGAQVIKVEPPGGDPLRAAPPLHGGESAFFNYLNENKLGAAIVSNDSRLEQLASHADIVIHDARGAEADALDALARAANPAAVVLSMTPYGRSGPRADWNASALSEWATSGFLYIAGDPAREPLSLPGYQAEFHAGMHAAVAALAGLRHARNTGEGQRVEISHQEAVLSDHAWVTTSWTHAGQVQRRIGALYAKCADGYVYLFNLVPYPNLFVMMERFDLLEDEDLQNPLSWMARFPEVFQALSEWAATKTKQEIYHAGQELRIAVSPVNTMEDVANSSQLAARQWFGEVAAGGARFKSPGFPYKLTGTPCEPRLPAPKLGQHTEDVLAHSFAWANAGVPAAPALGAIVNEGGPLSGIRVLEVTANWAGPIGGRHLADLGAEVIKIELATKPATRALIYIADDITWPEHYHRSGYFNKLNRNKKDVSLDLSKPAGREAFLKLVAQSDVVLENNAARVMSNLGLAYEDLAKANPAIVMCSMSGFGGTGPERNYSAYGSNIETISGLASLLGYAPGDAFGTGSYYADPVTGTHGVVAILAALHARRRTGRGQWIDMALLEAVAPFFAQQFLEYTVTGNVPLAQGNRWGELPQDVYPTAGKDCWLAVTITGGLALARAIGQPELKGASRAQIDAAIRAWAAAIDHNEAAERLQAAGIPAAPVMANWEIFSDNHLNDRDFFVRIRHAKAGTFWFPGFPWRFEATPTSVRMAAPLFAEHNGEVFTQLLGLSESAVAQLYSEGVASPHPVYGNGPSI